MRGYADPASESPLENKPTVYDGGDTGGMAVL